MGKATKYDKIVILKDNKFTVLNESFKHSDDFKGLMGSRFEIVSKQEFDETIEPYLDDDKELLCYYADNFGEVTADMIRNVDSSEDALKELFFDLSYSEKWDYFRKELNLDEEEAYIFNCVGGGRCFSKGMEFTHNKHLQHLINEFES